MAKQSLNLPYLLVTGAIVVALASGFTIFRSMWRDIQETREQVTARTAKLDERQAFLASINGKRASLNQQIQHEQQLDVLLPRDESIDDLARLLHRAAEGAGVVVIGLTNVSEAEQSTVRAQEGRGQATDFPPGVLPLAINLEVVGTYQQVRAFFDAIDRFVRLAEIRSLDLQRDNARPDQVVTKVSLRFYQHQKIVQPTPTPTNAQ